VYNTAGLVIGDGLVQIDTGHLQVWTGSTWTDVGNITGPAGATGATGVQGDTGATGVQGAPGLDALWNFVGAYGIGTSYAVGDVATYEGETWYRIDANGGTTGNTPAEGTFWTKIAEKGADGTGGGGLSITDFGQGFTDSLDAGKITTSKLYNENPNQGLNNQYVLEVTNGGVVVLPDQSIINGATLKTVAGNYAGITAGPASPAGKDEDSWVWVDNDGATIATKYSTDNYQWKFGNDGDLAIPPGKTIRNAMTGDDLLDIKVVRQDTAPTAANGTLWFNTVEGRLYIKYSDQWVDAAPLVQPPPDTDLDVNSITFPDASVQTSAYINRLDNGDYTALFGEDGWLRVRKLSTNQSYFNLVPTKNENNTYGVQIDIDNQAGWTFLDNGTLTLPASSNDLYTTTNALIKSIADIQISAGDDVGSNWVFGGNGNLTLPSGGTISEGTVTSNPTIQLTPDNPIVASQKLVIKGGGSYIYTDNGIEINYYVNTAIVGDTLTFYVYSDTYADQTLYWWIYPTNAGIGDSNSGTVVLTGTGGEFTILIDSDAYEFTVRVSPENNNYDPANVGVESGLINADAPTFGSDYHLHLTTGDLTETSIFLGTDDHNVRTTTDGKIQITTPSQVNKVWEFGTDGNLTLPGAITRVVAGTVAKDGPSLSDIGEGEAATVTVSPTNNTNLTVGTVTGVVLDAGFTLDITVAANGDISAVVTASDPNLDVGDFGVIDGGGLLGGTQGVDGTTFTVATLTNIIVPTALDLTKSVNKLANGAYTLANGVEGQIMYLVRQTGSMGATVTVANSRIDGVIQTDIPFSPFTDGTDPINMATLIFTDDAWQNMGGVWSLT
jgi:hypothetical protein